MFMTFVEAEDIEVKFKDCVDGDTAKFIYDSKQITARFLAIDTPETVHPTKEVEEYGKEASNYTCKRIKEAKEIILEFDEDSEKKDKYDRYLVWVFVDGSLLQEELVSKGFASVSYLYGDYKYTDKLEKVEQIAEENKIGIWNNTSIDDEIQESIENLDNNEESVIDSNNTIEDTTIANITSFIVKYKEYIILIGSLIIVSLFNIKSKNKIKRKLKNKIKKDIKRRLK